MTPTTPDQYERALELLDRDGFWDRYLSEREDDERPKLVVLPSRPIGGGESGRKSQARSKRWSRLQRVALAAAAAGIAIVAGVVVTNSGSEPEPLDVFTNTVPTVPTEVPLVVVPVDPAPDPTPVPPPLTPVPEPDVEPTTPPEADSALPPDPASTQPQDDGVDSQGDDGTEAAPEPVEDSAVQESAETADPPAETTAAPATAADEGVEADDAVEPVGDGEAVEDQESSFTSGSEPVYSGSDVTFAADTFVGLDDPCPAGTYGIPNQGAGLACRPDGFLPITSEELCNQAIAAGLTGEWLEGDPVSVCSRGWGFPVPAEGCSPNRVETIPLTENHPDRAGLPACVFVVLYQSAQEAAPVGSGLNAICINADVLVGNASLSDSRVGEIVRQGDREYLITSGAECGFDCAGGFDMNCDGRLGDFCPVEFDRLTVEGAQGCQAALTAEE